MIREKIREGIMNLELEGSIKEGKLYLSSSDVIKIFKNLHSQGVVIQVVPDDSPQIFRAVEPLIKE